jgi:hypothetical protein
LKDGSIRVTMFDSIRLLIILHQLNIMNSGLNLRDLSVTNRMNEFKDLTNLIYLIYFIFDVIIEYIINQAKMKNEIFKRLNINSHTN